MHNNSDRDLIYTHEACTTRRVLYTTVEALRNAPAPRDSWYTGAHVTASSENGSLESIEPGVRLALSRLIAWSPHALCVCKMDDPDNPDHPIIFANDNFFVQTGYSPEEVINRNCRFLQGPGWGCANVIRLDRRYPKRNRIFSFLPT